MDRYGEAIEADLHEHYGVDLLDFFRGVHSWRKLQLLIDKLPTSSHLSAARIEDDEMAERWLELNEDKKSSPTPPPWTDLTYQAQLLMAVVEGLEGLTHLVHSIAAGKATTPPKPLPRPRSALDRVKHKQVMKQHTSLVAEVYEAQNRWEAVHG